MDLLYDSVFIQRKVRELAFQIRKDYDYICDDQGSIVVVPILKAAFMFAADFVRHFPVVNTLQVEFIGISSYDATSHTYPILTLGPPRRAITTKHIIILDTIYDSGETMRFAIEKIKCHNPASIKTCCLINKNENSEPDYYAFKCDKDKFVVGYGTDYNGLYRDRRDIYVIGGNK